MLKGAKDRKYRQTEISVVEGKFTVVLDTAPFHRCPPGRSAKREALIRHRFPRRIGNQRRRRLSRFAHSIAVTSRRSRRPPSLSHPTRFSSFCPSFIFFLYCFFFIFLYFFLFSLNRAFPLDFTPAPACPRLEAISDLRDRPRPVPVAVNPRQPLIETEDSGATSGRAISTFVRGAGTETARRSWVPARHTLSRTRGPPSMEFSFGSAKSRFDPFHEIFIYNIQEKKIPGQNGSPCETRLSPQVS